MFGEVYIFILVALIPFFSWQQREEGRNLVSMLITGCFIILWLITETIPIVWDITTIFVMCFVLWMIASMFWSNSRQSSLDLFFMICCLMIFLVARRITLESLMAMLFIPGVIFAAASLYYYKSDHPKKRWPVFGNRNHVGAFLTIPLFTGIWLTFNISWFIAPLVLLVAVAIALCQCRGAQAGVIAGLIYVASMQSLWILLFLPVIILSLFIVRKRMIRPVAFTERMSFIVAALYLIKKSPITGYGLRTFRREYPAIIPKLLNSSILKRFYARNVTVESQTTHRVHNDHLEIIVELGIIGYVLFLSIFSSLLWSENPLLAGAIIAVAVHGLFFFPLREAHTAYPFWALAGGMAGTTGAIVTINLMITGILIFIVGRITYEIAVKTLGLSYYDQSVKIAVSPQPNDNSGKKKLKIKQKFIEDAIRCDPYNNIYLNEGYYYNVFDNPEPAFQYASRCMENYDGGKVKWGIADSYARALLRVGGFGVAKMAVKYAVNICPDYRQSQELLKQIEAMEIQAAEMQGAAR